MSTATLEDLATVPLIDEPWRTWILHSKDCIMMGSTEAPADTPVGLLFSIVREGYITHVHCVELGADWAALPGAPKVYEGDEIKIIDVGTKTTFPCCTT